MKRIFVITMLFMVLLGIFITGCEKLKTDEEEVKTLVLKDVKIMEKYLVPEEGEEEYVSESPMTTSSVNSSSTTDEVWASYIHIDHGNKTRKIKDIVIDEEAGTGTVWVYVEIPIEITLYDIDNDNKTMDELDKKLATISGEIIYDVAREGDYWKIANRSLNNFKSFDTENEVESSIEFTVTEPEPVSPNKDLNISVTVNFSDQDTNTDSVITKLKVPAFNITTIIYSMKSNVAYSNNITVKEDVEPGV
ncbi:hypothetical protein [Halothermothrix orenii]|uniref:Cadherin domain-containing protein n=1 Tax=Halothermothrix orenii (strain H 168 / OCM 544 / DSM 9562) TaxID=373903 RepID=B8CX58_HALOH|nr:hypothetical protein [Halothermothrix orenii]ACL69877.1 hypothetical protein Hore_11250 [Halothermothrix orenii H 168]